jgi:pimeloyl-ACP methyl ester carboxylesterase
MHATGELRRVDPFAIVILSPFDSVGFYEREVSLPGSLQDYLDEMLRAEGESAIVPPSVFPHWQVSAATLRAATTVAGPWDQFRSRDGRTDTVGSLGVPTAVVLGGSDFASVPDPAVVYELLRGDPSVRTALVEGAPHNFAGVEPQVARLLADWLKEIG